MIFTNLLEKLINMNCFILSDNEISNKIFNKVISLDKSKIFNINFNITHSNQKNVKIFRFFS